MPFTREERISGVKETRTSGASPLDICVLVNDDYYTTREDLYYLEATFGPYAANRRAQGSYMTDADAGGSKETYWASARCPDDRDRASFVIRPQTATTNNPGFAKAALIAFAKRAAQQHGCTDLQLPR
ncbi:hypothetical protein [Streptomyces sp. NPDC003036]|uniref:hypothetical protein n=1 Tax=Streptomyces sp. NPDC003036 TaxID=3154442 RepID=UPI0033BBEC28